MVAYEPSLLENLIANMSTLSAVFHKSPDSFVVGGRQAVSTIDVPVEPLPEYDAEQSGGGSEEPAATGGDDNGLDDLMGLDSGSAPPAAKPANEVDDLMDLLGGPGPTPSPAQPAAASGGAASPVTMWLNPEAQTGGVKLGGSFRRTGGKMYMDIKAQNCGQQPMSGFALQVNKNSFQLQPDDMNLGLNLAPGAVGDVSVSLNTGGQMQLNKPLMNVQVAVKNNIGVSYFSCQPPLHMVYTEDGAMGKNDFLGMWRGLPAESESKSTIDSVSAPSPDALSAKLKQNNLFEVARMPGSDGQQVIYLSAKLVNNIVLLVEVSMWPGRAAVSMKTKNNALAEPFHESIKQLLA